ncbi:hypothetical protein F8A86_04335 [Betaproteobacteria bacterium SCN1]|jgi:hypothetical protein|nr:hypothetical protein F8A86_04335 [Betaproteobacteria bacterium SCN1]
MIRNLVAALAIVMPSAVHSKDLYRPPSAGDSGTYYVLSTEKLKNGQLKVLTSRVGKGAAYTDFTELKVNCNSKQYFELAGGNEDGKKEKPSAPLTDWSARSKWTSLVPGSSKSDLVNFVCSKQK